MYGRFWVITEGLAARLFRSDAAPHQTESVPHFTGIRIGFAVWVCGAFGDTVDWRGKKLRLRPDGRSGK